MRPWRIACENYCIFPELCETRRPRMNFPHAGASRYPGPTWPSSFKRFHMAVGPLPPLDKLACIVGLLFMATLLLWLPLQLCNEVDSGEKGLATLVMCVGLAIQTVEVCHDAPDCHILLASAILLSSLQSKCPLHFFYKKQGKAHCP